MKLTGYRSTIVLLLVLLSTHAAHAQTWFESGDAPQLLPGQATSGVGPLNNILGGIGTVDDVDLYSIRITNTMTFGATTTINPPAMIDTQLFLFNVDGRGVTMHDDQPDGNTRSTITNRFVTTPGVYYLAVSTFDKDPLNPAALEIWADGPVEQERPPDGPGMSNPVLASWSTDPIASTGDYRVTLTGAEFLPEPASALLLAAGAVLLARRRTPSR